MQQSNKNNAAVKSKLNINGVTDNVAGPGNTDKASSRDSAYTAGEL